MIIRHYAEVKPGTYSGTPQGVQMREMITTWCKYAVPFP